MTLKLIRQFTFTAVWVLFVGIVNAQDKYRSEIGAMGGGSFYLGDANNQLFVNNQLSYGLIYRQKLDTRLAISGSWNKTNVVGTSFNNPINAIDLCGEFNFFDLDNKIYKPNSKPYSLYIFAGIGGMIFPYQTTLPNTIAFSFPVGLGYKVMLGERFNLNFIWSQRLLLSDKMEGKLEFNNAKGLNGTNIFNNDVLSTFSVGLTYNIWRKKCNCLQINR